MNVVNIYLANMVSNNFEALLFTNWANDIFRIQAVNSCINVFVIKILKFIIFLKNCLFCKDNKAMTFPT